MTNCGVNSSSRWLGLVIGLVTGLVNGLPAAFNVYAMELRETFNYSQSQVELVSSIALIGLGLSFLHSIIMDKFGYKVIYIITIVVAPVPCLLMYIATMFKPFFSKWGGLVGFFLLIAYFNNSFVFIQVTQIGISNFSKKDIGKIISVYIGVMGFGKIFLCIYYEVLFVGNLGGFFLVLALIWTFMAVLCFLLHRPSEAVGEEDRLIGQPDPYNGVEKLTDVPNKSENTIPEILKSTYFHMMFWSSLIFFGCFITFMDNVTVFGESVRLENPLVLIYLMAATMVTSRILLGVVYDRFQSYKCGFLCLYLSYFCFLVAMVIGLTCFNKTSVFLMTFLVGVSVAGGNTLPMTLLASHFGRKHYSTMLGGLQFFLIPTVVIFQMCFGYFYDIEIQSYGRGNEVCYGLHCFRWTFVMLLSVSSLVILVQVANHICIHRGNSPNK